MNDDFGHSFPESEIKDNEAPVWAGLSSDNLDDHVERNQEELDIVSKDSMKEAFRCVGLDALSIAQSLKNLVSAKADRDKLKALEIVLKVRGDFAQSAVDERPIKITFGKEMTEVEIDSTSPPNPET